MKKRQTDMKYSYNVYARPETMPITKQKAIHRHEYNILVQCIRASRNNAWVEKQNMRYKRQKTK